MRLFGLTIRSLVLCFLLVWGCKQGEGEHCQVNSDCEDGLICEYDDLQDKVNGTCRPENRPDGAVDSQPSDTIPDQTSDIPDQTSDILDQTSDIEVSDTKTTDTLKPDTAQADTSPEPDTIELDTAVEIDAAKKDN